MLLFLKLYWPLCLAASNRCSSVPGRWGLVEQGGIFGQSRRVEEEAGSRESLHPRSARSRRDTLSQSQARVGGRENFHFDLDGLL